MVMHHTLLGKLEVSVGEDTQHGHPDTRQIFDDLLLGHGRQIHKVQVASQDDQAGLDVAHHLAHKEKQHPQNRNVSTHTCSNGLEQDIKDKSVHTEENKPHAMDECVRLQRRQTRWWVGREQ